jgi:hypothetical protein
MKIAVPVLLLPLALGLAGTVRADDCEHQARREERIDAAGVKTLHVIARAGSLRIDGQANAGAIAVRGTACASRESALDDIQLKVGRSGASATVEAVIPESFNWLVGGQARLDLVLEVPQGVALEVEDGSGSIEIRHVASAAVRDGSGEMVIEDVAGEVRITDGSGGIEVRGAGSVVIDEDGSGGIDISGVRGNVLVKDDGSGSISVREVAGDFRVEDDGSGGISHTAVHGRVRIPSRD